MKGRFSSSHADRVTVRERDRAIVTKYEAGSSTPFLALEYNLTRERVCQILRRSNTIELVKGRRRLAQRVIAEEAAEIKATAKAQYKAKIEAAVELVRKGESVRQATNKIFNRGYHTQFNYAVGAACRAAGVGFNHGRHRDFTYRKKRLLDLIGSGMSVAEAIKIMRAEGSKIYYNWVYSNMPEMIRSRNRKKTPSQPPQISVRPGDWDEKHTQELLSLYYKGVTGQQIADIFGPPYTRSAILGKIDRLRKSGKLCNPMKGTD
jgi:hypothetical protein